MEEILTSEGSYGLFEKARDSLNADDYPFEDIRAVFTDYYENYISGKDLSYREVKKETTDDTAVYSVYTGAAQLCTVTFSSVSDSDLGFGRHSWQLEKVSAESVIQSFDSVVVRVDIAPTAEFTLNGKTVGSDYVTSEDIAISNASEFEQLFTTPCTLTRYEIGPIYSDIVVQDGNGNVISPESEDSSFISYTILPEIHEFTIIVPSDVNVSICGADPAGICEPVKTENLFEGLESYADGWETLTYYFEIYQEPEIIVTDADNTVLEPMILSGDRYYYTHSGGNIEARCSASAQQYFESFTTYSNTPTGGNYHTVLSRVLTGSELFSYIYNSRESMFFAPDTEVEYKDLTFGNYFMLNNKCFTCTISYSASMTASRWTGQASFDLENAYQLVFVKVGTGWLCAVMQDLNA